MRNTVVTLLSIFSFVVDSYGADRIFDVDTTFTSRQEMTEVVVTSIKKNAALTMQPLSSSEITLGEAQKGETATMRDISGLAPNFFMPDYGSSITSAIYIRGVGSRINTPAVALYVDDMPYIDKSAFSFDFIDVDRIEVLRGPQGTLYGRNAMGGLIKISTASPFRATSTNVRVSGEAQSGKLAAFVSHRHHCTERMAFQAEGFVSRANGYFENDYTGDDVDDHRRAGARLRAMFIPTSDAKIDLTLNYQHTDEGGYPYEYLGTTADEETMPELIGQISSNRPSSYWRSLFNSGLKVLLQSEKVVLTSVTGFQLLNDEMKLDQDFLVTDTFTMRQVQRQRTLSEELVAKQRNKRAAWQWTSGLFVYHQWLETSSPVTFMSGGVSMIQNAMDAAMQAAGSPVSIVLTDNSFDVPTAATTPITGIALYHESSFDALSWLNVSLGLRIDYELLKIDYETSCKPNFDMTQNGSTYSGNLNVHYEGSLKNDYLRLLPKAAMLIRLPDERSNIFLTVSRGQRSGGYNVQSFSDIVSATMSGKPGTTTFTDEEIENQITYKPESCWNYELGTHLSPTDWLTASLAVFYMDIYDQQVARFADGGLGRRMVNAGRSASCGIEASATARLLDDRLTLNANYGYTHSHFKRYETVIDEQTVSYNHNRVPFAPDNTLYVSADYTLLSNASAPLTRLAIGADYNLIGTIYWTESNDAKQSPYDLIGAHVNASFRHLSVNIWTKNLADRSYNTFYFESLNHRFAQRGKPLQIGLDIAVKF